MWLARRGARGGRSSGFLEDETHAAAIRFPQKSARTIGRGTSGVNSSRLPDRYADFRFIQASNRIGWRSTVPCASLSDPYRKPQSFTAVSWKKEPRIGDW